jgi:hypothetical protein
MLPLYHRYGSPIAVNYLLCIYKVRWDIPASHRGCKQKRSAPALFPTRNPPPPTGSAPISLVFRSPAGPRPRAVAPGPGAGPRRRAP